MANDAIIARVKTNLGYMDNVPADVFDDIVSTIDAAKLKLERESKIVLDEFDPLDADLLVSYSLYKYRHRDSDRDMPRSLRLDLNDRRVSDAARGVT